MTRAEERLVVCGYEGERKRPEGCWYDLVDDALADDARDEPADDGEGTVRRFRRGSQLALALVAPEPAAESPEVTTPDWLRRDAAVERPRLRTLSPSSAADDATPARAPQQAAGLLRGRLAHRLLQVLPELAAEQRAERARRWLTRQTTGLGAGERDELLRRTLLVVEHPGLRALFAPGSRAEVPIVGTLPGDPPFAVSGQIDRLAVTPDAVLIADFKANHAPPRRLEDVPKAYVTQLSLYRAVLQRLYPGRAVRAALVWTEVPEIMELPAAVLDEALTQL
jgi:ATP-dependent helicase/nuclease subunit A